MFVEIIRDIVHNLRRSPRRIVLLNRNKVESIIEEYQAYLSRSSRSVIVKRIIRRKIVAPKSGAKKPNNSCILAAESELGNIRQRFTSNIL